ncbi:MAG TPA: phosphatidylglycerol lysyltransferase domain-containing protein [Synergistaceae bacterium]|nr:phosphatidylglycerol lysyltransferase domain-containing protein [Synergistaceae bacterium]HPJ24974.1 phosphatidylglycerol lysyltransferase domain-containing protein [Synergistaceae bacterium]HPQ36820.1 phosphatidylglycerol lysyltransferase domain-containing protein [Synergistaceae bacterium]
MSSSPEFQPLRISHKEIIQKYLPSQGLLFCEFSFVNLFLWGDSYPVEWAIWKEKLVLYSTSQGYLFLPEHESCSPEELRELSQVTQENGRSGNIFFLRRDYAEPRRNLLEPFFIMENQRDYADYIYESPALAHLKGSKFAKRRNQINQFYKQNRHVKCIPLHPELYEEYKPLLKRWSRGKDTYEISQIEEERKALCRAFTFYKDLELQGLVLYADNHVAGLSLFSKCNEDFGLVHFEKADVRYKGAYQVINKETAKILEKQCPYINREQDLGIPGLRHAKESYLPYRLLETSFLYPRKE